MYSKIPNKSIVVQKYGGTSVGSVEKIHCIAERTRTLVNQGWNRLAIVVSAMAGTTDQLIRLVNQTNPLASPMHLDLAVAAGEQISAALMASALESKGVFAKPLLAYQAGIQTDGLHRQARIRSIDTQVVHECWRRSQIPVLAGFQGVSDSNEITTLGRGGSDTSAVALAAALGASFCEINTDVAGVFTCDPRIVPHAEPIPILDYDSALELAAMGSKVLHHRCVELAAKYKLPLIVRESFSSEEANKTMIMNQTDALESPVVSGITLDRNISKITVSGLPDGTLPLTKVFTKLAEHSINVDIIIQNKVADKMHLGFTVQTEDASVSVDTLEELRNLFPNLEIKRVDSLAKITLVGLGMKSYSGVASRVFEVLSTFNIETRMVSTSEIKISCVTSAEVSKLAVQKLHEAFFENSTPVKPNADASAPALTSP